jgi:outer membrane protein assembly factor BamB
MTSEPRDGSGRDERVNQIIAAYLRVADAGQAPDRAELLARHPDLADELRSFFADHDQAQRLAAPAAAPETPTVAPGEAISPAPLDTIRYFGDYELLQEIARGGMGVVYRARQVSLNRFVALKMILSGQLASEDDVKRFHLEAQTAAGLQHPNIVAIHEVGEHDGQHYFSMDFVEGQSLADLVRENPLPPERAVRWVRTIAEGIQYAHQRGVLHRDLKPSNVLIDSFGQPRVTDFGLAKRIDRDTRLTATGAVVGTPSYMPPEQASADRGAIGPASDVYSLGAVLYELVTGRPPFRAATPFDTLLQVLEAEPAPPRLLNPAVGRDLETIILKCLAKQPARRYASAQALADDLGALLEGRPIQARRPGLAEKAVRWAGKQRRSAIVATVAAVIAVAAAAGGLWSWNQHREAQLGRLRLTTEGEAALTVEVLHADRDEPLVNPFTAPTKDPVRLPGGPCRVRVSRPGLPSETYQALVPPGSPRQAHLALDNRTLGAPVPIDFGRERGEIVDFGDRSDLILLDEWKRLARINIATGKPVWEMAFDRDNQDPQKGPVGNALEERHHVLGTNSYGPLLLRSASDRKDDGILIWLGSSPLGQTWGKNPVSVWALSAKDGKELWAHTADRPMVLGPPVLFDVDSDGTPDLLVTFGSQIGSSTWIEALSGRTGQSLWRTPLEDRRFPNGRILPATSTARVLKVDGKETFFGLVGSHLLQLDPKTGRLTGEIHDLGFTPAGQPQFFAATVGPVLLCPLQKAQDRLGLIAVSFADGRTLWSRDLGLRWSALNDPQNVFRPTPPLEWPLLADLDGDRRTQVLIPDRNGPQRELNVEVVEGATGETRWRRSLGRSMVNVESGLLDNGSYPPAESEKLPLQLIVGPDLDGDGRREVFTARGVRHTDSPYSSKNLLLVEALSGSDGHTLWRWAHRELNAGELGALHWWQAGPDSLPELVVPYGAAYVLTARTGRLAHVLTDFGVPRVADLDGDGIPDLYAYRPRKDGESGAGNAGALYTVRGQPPEAWRWLAQCQPACDLDGDGVADVFPFNQGQGDRVAAVSGRTGRLLWRRSDVHVTYPQDVDSVPAGAAPATVLVQAGFVDQHPVPLLALDGATGRTRWTADALKTSAEGEAVEHFRLAQGFTSEDGSPGVVCAYLHTRQPNATREPRYQPWLATLSAQDGSVRWRRTLGEAVETKAMRDADGKGMTWSLPHRERLRPVQVDLNGDGVRDFLFWSSDVDVLGERPPIYSLYAIDGRNGSPLWTWALPQGQNPHEPVTTAWHNYIEGQYPLPIVADLDGDGVPEVVVAGDEGPVQFGGQQTTRVVALNGRDGTPKWTWSGPTLKAWFAGFGGPSQGDAIIHLDFRRAPPRLLNRADGRFVCAAVLEAEEIPAPKGYPLRGPFQRPRLVLALFDAAGHIRQRRVPVNPGKLVGRNFLFWTHDLDGDGQDDVLFFADGKLMATRAGLEQVLWEWPLPGPGTEVIDIRPAGAHHPATVVVTVGSIVYGIDGRTGRPRWRCEGPGRLAAVLPTGDPRDLPGILYYLNNQQNEVQATVCRLAQMTDAAGVAQPASPALAEEGTSDDAAPTRCLPWVGELDRLRYRVGWFLVFRSSSLPWTIGLVLVLAVAAVLLVGAVRRRSWRRGVVVVALGAAVLTAGMVKFGPPDFEAVVTTPLFVFVGVLGFWTVRRRWWRAVALLAASLALSALLGWLWLRYDARTLESWEHYSEDGWYTVWLLGAYVSGGLLLLAWLGRVAVRLTRRVLRRPLAD